MAERDTTCDSMYMLKHIREIGKAIRNKYYWVDEEEDIFLVMDNAGGHGTSDSKEEYVRILKEEYNVTVVWQVPNSPETNVLDLGVWMAIQAEVENIHRTKVMQNDVLAASINTAFDNLEERILLHVYNRWIKVLDLIIKGEGDNQLVEKCRKRDEKVEDLVYVDEKKCGLLAVKEESSDEEEEDYDETSDVESFED